MKSSNSNTTPSSTLESTPNERLFENQQKQEIKNNQMNFGIPGEIQLQDDDIDNKINR